MVNSEFDGILSDCWIGNKLDFVQLKKKFLESVEKIFEYENSESVEKIFEYENSIYRISKDQSSITIKIDHVDDCTEFVIPDGVDEIDSVAFNGCTLLSSITIPSSVTSIGENAFNGCESLKYVFKCIHLL